MRSSRPARTASPIPRTIAAHASRRRASSPRPATRARSSVQAGRVELADGARLSSSTSGIGNGGSRHDRRDGRRVAARSARRRQRVGDQSVDRGRSGRRSARSTRRGSATPAPVAIQAASLDARGRRRDRRQHGAARRRRAASTIDVGIACTYRTRGSRANRLRSATAPARPARSRSTRTTSTLENAARISASTVDGTGGAVHVHAATRYGSPAAPRSPRRRRALGDGRRRRDLAAETRSISRAAARSPRAARGAGKAGALRLTATDALTLDSSALRTSALGLRRRRHRDRGRPHGGAHGLHDRARRPAA